MGHDHAAIYEGVRRRVTELVGGLDDAALDVEVAATPGWRIRDVVAHLAGSPADILAGRLEGVATDSWTAAQVEARRDVAIADVLAQWERDAAVVAPLIGGFDPVPRAMMLTDAWTHEQDLRTTLGRPGEREGDAVAFSFPNVTKGLVASWPDGLRIEHEDGVTELAVESAARPTTVRTNRFEVVRAATGRRSLDQISAWDWDGECRPEAMVLATFSPPRPTPLTE